MKLHFEVYGISLYSLSQGQSNKYRGYDTQALLRAHEWGLLDGEPVGVPPFREGHSYVFMRNRRCAYQVEIDLEKDHFTLLKEKRYHHDTPEVRVLAEGNFEPNSKPDDKESEITFYVVATDGWHYSLHCYKHAKPIRRDY